MDREISAHLLRLRRRHPFFAALSMFARYVFDEAITACETDGRTVRIEPAYLARLPPPQRSGLLLHVTLHAALLHAVRCGRRQPALWNTAADIVVNNLMLESGTFEPPPETAVEPAWDGLSVEQVYERLLALPRAHPSLVALADRMQGKAPHSGEPTADGCSVPDGDTSSQAESSGVARAEGQTAGSRRSSPVGDPAASARSPHRDAVRVAALRYPTRADLARPGAGEPATAAGQDRSAHTMAAHWRTALRKARAVARLSRSGGAGRGDDGAGLVREFDAALNSRLDWRTRLWRYLVRTPTDFSGFDRRFVHQGLYLDALESESLTVHVAVDTSGSVDEGQLSAFIAEVRGVKQAYAGIDVQLYFADAAVAGPFPLTDSLVLPEPIGGGGTDFRPFFATVAAATGPFDHALQIYLTDGDGDFPHERPALDTLWVVTEGGEDEFPFGEVARLSDDYAQETPAWT